MTPVCNLFVFLVQASMTDCPDIEFNYDDADLPENELTELYSYTEGPEYQLNLKVKHLVPPTLILPLHFFGFVAP